MGPLSNQRHEQFAQLLAQGKSGIDAYEQAGFSAKNRRVAMKNASVLKAKIRDRLIELQEVSTIPFVLTKDWLLGEMVDVAKEAKEDRQHSPRIRALELLGREKNAFTERKDIMVRSFDQYTTEELEAFLASERAQGITPRNGGSGARGRAGKKATGRAQG